MTNSDWQQQAIARDRKDGAAESRGIKGKAENRKGPLESTERTRQMKAQEIMDRSTERTKKQQEHITLCS